MNRNRKPFFVMMEGVMGLFTASAESAAASAVHQIQTAATVTLPLPREMHTITCGMRGCMHEGNVLSV